MFHNYFPSLILNIAFSESRILLLHDFLIHLTLRFGYLHNFFQLLIPTHQELFHKKFIYLLNFPRTIKTMKGANFFHLKHFQINFQINWKNDKCNISILLHSTNTRYVTPEVIFLDH